MYLLRVLSLVLLVVYTSADLTPADIMRFVTVRRQCEMSNPVDREVIERVRQAELVNDRNFDCYVSCILKGSNFMGADGSLNVPFALDKVPENFPLHDALVDAINICGSRRGNDECSTAHELFMCFHEQNIPNLLLGQFRG
ncbi:general odorant-binding protein 69a-like [Chelonus insularis]|uniref:general odorant-binding protein 69a-like n=1 Tax=Chelonus insularis TaxID=460826 RepID=UPI00158ADDAE|nr:general odorant-binding protein 69a-like [Chelonus insularis]